MRKFMVYVDDGDNVFKTAVVAKDEENARQQFNGAGDVVCCRDINYYCVSEEYLLDVLGHSQLGKTEKQLIMSALRQSDLLV